MLVHSQDPAASLDWRRVAALSGSFALHAVALALIAMPLARSLPRVLPMTMAATIVELPLPRPALPMPPDPQPLPHTHVIHDRVPAHPTVPVAPTPAPAVTANVTGTSPAPVAPVASKAAPAPGESRTLAYAGPLHLRYPLAAVRQHLQGTVVLRVLVDADGRVERVEIEHGSGHGQLDSAAREAVQGARFRPVLKDGKPMPAWGLVPIAFRLDRA
jgi:protein TonB